MSAPELVARARAISKRIKVGPMTFIPYSAETEHIFELPKLACSLADALETALSDNAALQARIDAVLELAHSSDDGSEYEHDDGCEGDPTCSACWAQDIRNALADPAVKG